MGRWMDGYPSFPISIGVRRIKGRSFDDAIERSSSGYVFFVDIVFSVILSLAWFALIMYEYQYLENVLYNF